MYLRRQSGESYLLRVRQFGILFSDEDPVAIVSYDDRRVLIRGDVTKGSRLRHIERLTHKLEGFHVGYCTKEEMLDCANGTVSAPTLKESATDGGVQCDAS